MSYIYAIIDKNTGKHIYIGQTTRPVKIRQAEHFRDIEHKKHKIKQLNTYNVEDLDFEILCTLDTDNSLVLSMMECFYNDLLHPINRCVIQGFRGNTVTLKRTGNKELCEDVIKIIKKYY